MIPASVLHPDHCRRKTLLEAMKGFQFQKDASRRLVINTGQIRISKTIRMVIMS